MRYFSSVAPDGKTLIDNLPLSAIVTYRLLNKNFGIRSKTDAKVKDYCGISDKKSNLRPSVYVNVVQILNVTFVFIFLRIVE